MDKAQYSRIITNFKAWELLSCGTLKINMKTIKIIEGQVMVCEPLVSNFTGEFSPKEPKWYVGALQEAVAKRMNKCMDNCEIYNY